MHYTHYMHCNTLHTCMRSSKHPWNWCIHTVTPAHRYAQMLINISCTCTSWCTHANKCKTHIHWTEAYVHACMYLNINRKVWSHLSLQVSLHDVGSRYKLITYKHGSHYITFTHAHSLQYSAISCIALHHISLHCTNTGTDKPNKQAQLHSMGYHINSETHTYVHASIPDILHCSKLPYIFTLQKNMHTHWKCPKTWLPDLRWP